MQVCELKRKQPLAIKEVLTLCIGFFDGVHRGHQKLLKAAKRYGLPCAVLMFGDDLRLKLRQEEALLTTFSDRVAFMETYGVEYLFYLPFTEELAALSPQEFVSEYLDVLPLEHIVVGQDFHFGHNASGDVKTLASLVACPVHAVTLIDENGEKVSSSFIKKLLRAGDIKKATHLLGHPYSLNGIIGHGRQNGHKLGFPTANIAMDASIILPKNGVYAASATVDGKAYLAMVNIGVHPTIDVLATPIIEAHLLNFNGDIYGKMMRISFLDFIRDEKPFSSLEALRDQLRDDKALIQGRFQELLAKL